jgi:hypothetical protein
MVSIHRNGGQHPPEYTVKGFRDAFFGCHLLKGLLSLKYLILDFFLVF